MLSRILIVFVMFLSFQVSWAQSTTSTSVATKSEGESKAPLIQQKTYQADPNVTDTKLKAENGSLSQWSAKFNLTYYGPRVGDIEDPQQPNPDGTVGNHATAIGGSIAARYRLDSDTALSFGTGVNSVTPFHQIKRFDVTTPYLSYDKVFRIGGWQTRQSIGVSDTTTPEYRDVGEIAGVSYAFSWFHSLGSSRWSGGLESSFGYFFYNRGYERTDKLAQQYNWGLYPTLKYRATDKFGLYTSYTLSWWNPRMLNNAFAMWNSTPSERLGVEYAFTRDIYFSPYLNFYPMSFNWNSTTLNFYTVFSLL